MSRIGCLCLVLSASIGAATQAQQSRSLEVRLSSSDCPKNIKAAVNGYDTKRITLVEDKEPCHWTGENEEGTFGSGAYFSLRLGNARTECHYADARDDDARPGFAILRFLSTVSPVNVIEVKTVGWTKPIPTSYLRKVIPLSPLHPLGRFCIETGTLDNTTNKIDDVAFELEKIELQIGADTPDRRATGLRVNDLQSVMRDNQVELKPDGVVYRLYVQRAREGDLSLNAIALDVWKLRDLKLEKLVVVRVK